MRTNFCFLYAQLYNTNSDKQIVSSSSKNYSAVHTYSLKDFLNFLNSNSVKSPDDVFKNENRYSYLKLVDRKTLKLLFNKPIGPSSHVIISEDEKYIFCLSTLNYKHAYQLLVLNINGQLLKKINVYTDEIVMQEKELRAFHQKFPEVLPYLRSIKRVVNQNDSYILHISNTDTNIVTSKAKILLNKYYRSASLYSHSINNKNNETIWYDVTLPKVKLIHKRSILSGIEIKTQNGWNLILLDSTQAVKK